MAQGKQITRRLETTARQRLRSLLLIAANMAGCVVMILVVLSFFLILDDVLKYG